MSSMGNSQDDAQHSSSTDKKLNASSEQQPSQQDADQTKSNKPDSNLNKAEQTDSLPIKDVTKKLNEPLLGTTVDSTVNLDSRTSGALNKEAMTYKTAKPQPDRLSQIGGQFDVAHPRIAHPDFNPKTKDSALDPDRPLSDIPAPSPRYQQPIKKLLHEMIADNKALTKVIHDANQRTQPDLYQQGQYDNSSKWALIASPALASHLELLQLGGLINLPAAFFEPVAAHETVSTTTASSAIATKATTVKEPLELLSPLTEMTLLDMSDIYRVCQQYPSLTRYGFMVSADTETKPTLADISQLSATMPEMINDIFAPNWELILYPERFDNGVDSLITDILACSVAVHILKQCQTRQSVNRSITAQQICQHMRSYVLSQCNIHPQYEQQYRQIRLFVGHVVVAAHYLGLKITHAAHHDQASHTNVKGEPSANLGQPIYLNISSRTALLTRYPNISDYYINGWS